METFSALLALCAGNSPVTGHDLASFQYFLGGQFKLDREAHYKHIAKWIYLIQHSLKI